MCMEEMYSLVFLFDFLFVILIKRKFLLVTSNHRRALTEAQAGGTVRIKYLFLFISSGFAGREPICIASFKVSAMR